MRTIVIFILFFAFGCNNQQNKKRIKKDDYILEGDIISDTILNGLINYYDVNDILVYRATFSNNVKNGFAFNYYPNGMIRDQTFFYFGKQNGEHIENDSTGKISYKDFYYYGKQIGPVNFYREDGSLKEFYFVNFEGETLLYRSYDSIVQPKVNPDNYFHMHISDALSDNQKRAQLFLYILQLPEYSLNYKICIKDTQNKITPIIDISTNEVFYQTYLPPLKNKNSYCILLTTFDSSTKRKQSIIKELILNE